MNEINIEVSYLRTEEERILASFTRHLIEIAAVAKARGDNTCPTTALDTMRVPAIALDRNGFVVDVNAAAEAVFDDDLKIKGGRLFVHDRTARALLKKASDQLRRPRLIPLAIKPFIVPRRDRFPVVLRIWPFAGQTDLRAARNASPIHAILSVFPVLPVHRQPPYLM
ncbi:MAG TPA: hypothetical protein VLZ74_08540 [Methylocella sp.]|nr:hypothetical protein [Methylocella sp.]